MADPTRIFNFDETAIHLGARTKKCLSLSLKATKAGDPKHCFMQCSGISDKTSITSEIMVNAAGEYSPPMIIYNRTRRPKHSDD